MVNMAHIAELAIVITYPTTRNGLFFTAVFRNLPEDESMAVPSLLGKELNPRSAFITSQCLTMNVISINGRLYHFSTKAIRS